VENIHPEINQYQVLDLKKGATQKEIEQAYRQKKKTAEVKKAYRILADPASRKLYDAGGVEPTIDYKLIRPEIFYIHLKKLSPTSLGELKRAAKKVNNQKGPDTLILDLRDNAGGSIDLLPYLLGPFIGPDQYAYQFFHQGEKIDFKTKTGWLTSLVRYKKVVILVNKNTQSSAEVMAASLKKYHLGVLIGTTTKGWGTVERVFPIKHQIDPAQKQAVFLVHSLTLREDGQPIEGQGVEPDINIKQADWKKQLYAYFHYPELTKAVGDLF